MNTTTFQDSIEESVREKAEEISERLEPHIRDGKRHLESLNDRARSLINDHPAACLFGALALGYLVARLARRERS
ncbi:MAG: hypothetical protein H7X95_11020 [Deltaproteobacteria bacterium]|nr:hypothetical protein [Deltaproteobacteria bacterium]